MLVLAAAVQGAGTFLINSWRYSTLRVAGPLDTAYYNQQLWNLWHGNPPITVRPQNAYAIEGPEPWKTNHLRPVTLLLAAFYPVWPGVPLFYLVQSAVLASGVWPVFRIAARLADDSRCGVFAGLCYAAAPFVWLFGTTDFRYLHLGVPLVAWVFDALDRRRRAAFAVTVLLLLATRESYSVVVAVLGVSQLFRRRPWRENLAWATTAIATGAIWFWVHVAYLWFAFGPDSAAGYLRATADPVAAYGQNPGRMQSELRREWPRLATHFGPLGLAVIAPELAAPGVALAYPPLKMGLFTLHPAQQYTRYFTPAASVLIVAMAVSLGRCWRHFDSAVVKYVVGSVCIVLGIAGTVRCLAIGPDAVLRLPPRLGAGADVAALRSALHRIPAGEGVLAFRSILPNVSSRIELYDYYQLPPGRTLDDAIARCRWVMAERRLLLVHELATQGQAGAARQLAQLLSVSNADGRLDPPELVAIASRLARTAEGGAFRVEAATPHVVLLRRVQ